MASSLSVPASCSLLHLITSFMKLRKQIKKVYPEKKFLLHFDNISGFLAANSVFPPHDEISSPFIAESDAPAFFLKSFLQNLNECLAADSTEQCVRICFTPLTSLDASLIQLDSTSHVRVLDESLLP